jgi:hypothetical protein
MRFFWAYALFKINQVQWLVSEGFIAMHSLSIRCRSKRTWRLKWIRWSPYNVHHLDVIFIIITRDHHIIYLQFNLVKIMDLHCDCNGLISQQHCGWIHFQFRLSYHFVRAHAQWPKRATIYSWFFNWKYFAQLTSLLE